MTTSIVRPQDKDLEAALSLATAFALCLFLFHVAMNLWQAHNGWGYFRDEFYYIACGRHLAWGFVDQGPIVSVQARLAEMIFGHSLAGIRIFSGAAGAGRVYLTGILCWAIGGRRGAQALAMLAVAVAPCYLGGDGYLSMNSFESLFWLTCLLALILMLRGGSSRWWLVFGASAGLGLLNKPSMTFFLVALLIALVISPQRTLLLNRWCAAGVALLILIASPNLIWQMTHHWATLEFLHNGRVEGKNKALPPLAFLRQQIDTLHPLNALIWIPGVVWLLKRRDWRWLGLTYLIFLAIMMGMHAKDYYVIPIYPILFAAGAIAWQTKFAPGRADRLVALPIFEGILLLTSVLILPMSTPVLTPRQWLDYTAALHIRSKAVESENTASSELPQFYADRFGWQEEVDQIRAAYNSLSPEDKANTVIQCDNYGEAGAINFLAPDLPTAISGHNNYWLWGPGEKPGEILITIEHTTPEHFAPYYSSVQIIGHMTSRWAMPYEQRKTIFLLRGPHQTIQSLWPEKKEYI